MSLARTDQATGPDARIETLEARLSVGDPRGPLGAPERLLAAVRTELLPALSELLETAPYRAARISLPHLEIDLGTWPDDPTWSDVRARLVAELRRLLEPHLEFGQGDWGARGGAVAPVDTEPLRHAGQQTFQSNGSSARDDASILADGATDAADRVSNSAVYPLTDSATEPRWQGPESGKKSAQSYAANRWHAAPLGGSDMAGSDLGRDDPSSPKGTPHLQTSPGIRGRGAMSDAPLTMADRALIDRLNQIDAATDAQQPQALAQLLRDVSHLEIVLRALPRDTAKAALGSIGRAILDLFTPRADTLSKPPNMLRDLMNRAAPADQPVLKAMLQRGVEGKVALPAPRLSSQDRLGAAAVRATIKRAPPQVQPAQLLGSVARFPELLTALRLDSSEAERLPPLTPDIEAARGHLPWIAAVPTSSAATFLAALARLDPPRQFAALLHAVAVAPKLLQALWAEPPAARAALATVLRAALEPSSSRLLLDDWPQTPAAEGTLAAALRKSAPPGVPADVVEASAARALRLIEAARFLTSLPAEGEGRADLLARQDEVNSDPPKGDNFPTPAPDETSVLQTADPQALHHALGLPLDAPTTSSLVALWAENPRRIIDAIGPLSPSAVQTIFAATGLTWAAYLTDRHLTPTALRTASGLHKQSLTMAYLGLKPEELLRIVQEALPSGAVDLRARLAQLRGEARAPVAALSAALAAVLDNRALDFDALTGLTPAATVAAPEPHSMTPLETLTQALGPATAGTNPPALEVLLEGITPPEVRAVFGQIAAAWPETHRPSVPLDAGLLAPLLRVSKEGASGHDDTLIAQLTEAIIALIPDPSARGEVLRILTARLSHAPHGAPADPELRRIAHAALMAISVPNTTPKSAETRRPQTKTMPVTEAAGLVLLRPYLGMLLTRLDVVPSEGRLPRAVLPRAWAILDALSGTAADDPLKRVLLGVSADHPVPDPQAALEPAASEIIDGLLRAVITHWSRLGATSPGGLRATFLARTGRLAHEETGIHLHVVPGPFDMLIDGLPWSYTPVALPWMTQPIHVKWRGEDV